MTVKAILDEKGRAVTTANRQMTIAEAASVLNDRRIGALVVVDGKDGIVGILSERDIVRAVAAHGADALAKPVTAMMTAKVRTCGEDHTVDQVMEIMTTGRFRHIPVEREGKLAGIVSIGDVVRRRIQQVEQEAEEMKAYIAS